MSLSEMWDVDFQSAPQVSAVIEVAGVLGREAQRGLEEEEDDLRESVRFGRPCPRCERLIS